MSAVAPSDAALHPTLNDAQLAYIMNLGVERSYERGERLFTEGTPLEGFFVILDGRIQITKVVGESEVVLAEHGPGGFTGELSLLTGEPGPASATAIEPTRVLLLSRDGFREMILACPEVANLILPAMARRVSGIEVMVQQHERMASLGKLAAGLAHELNNPAAAATRAVAQLRENLRFLREGALGLTGSGLSPEHVQCLERLLAGARERLSESLGLSALERADLEDEVCAWLEDLGFDEATALASSLIEGRFSLDDLKEIQGNLPSEAVMPVLRWIGATLGTEVLLRDAERSLGRISKLVKAVKDYSYMDKARYEETDVHAGIEDTLAMLAHPLRPFKVEKQFDPDAPTICAYGPELNQVWTNLLTNAIDAMEPGGKIVIATVAEPDHLVVTVTDTGSGMPPEVAARIFEPFFTTKEPGKGTGLGLDIAYRIVTTRHRGTISCVSEPGRGTTFTVRLPIRPELSTSDAPSENDAVQSP